MKSRKLPVLVLIGLLLMATAAIAHADQNGDDAVFCCQTVNEKALADQAGGFIPDVLGCRALDGSLLSLLSCQGVLLGCGEQAFACVPSETETGKDCACARFLRPAFN